MPYAVCAPGLTAICTSVRCLSGSWPILFNWVVYFLIFKFSTYWKQVLSWVCVSQIFSLSLWLLLVFYFFFYIYVLGEWAHTCHAHGGMEFRWQLPAVSSLLPLCGTRDQTQALRIGSKHIYPLRHLISPAASLHSLWGVLYKKRIRRKEKKIKEKKRKCF